MQVVYLVGDHRRQKGGNEREKTTLICYELVTTVGNRGSILLGQSEELWRKHIKSVRPEDGGWDILPLIPFPIR